jgi:hypothetical protein
MTHQALTQLGARRDAIFYETALTYAQALGQQGLTARAILAATRGLYCPLRGDEPVLAAYPWPYAAIGWLIAHHPADRFLGNPRISFAHQATRMRGAGLRRRSARAWAVWHVVRHVAPSLPGDPAHSVRPPNQAQIAARLNQWGAPGEVAIWQAALK